MNFSFHLARTSPILFPFEREFARSSATLRNFENPRSNVPGDYIPCSSSGKTLAEQGICEIQKFTLASPVNPRTSQIPGNVGSNGNGRHYQDQTDRKNEQTMTQDKDLIFAQHTFFCFSATAQVAHLVLPDTQRQRFAKPKEPLFSNALNTAFQNFTNFATK